MMKEMRPDFGFQWAVKKDRVDLTDKLESIALASVRKRFSPEFINRMAVRELDNLHEGNYARFRLRPSEYEAWRESL